MYRRLVRGYVTATILVAAQLISPSPAETPEDAARQIKFGAEMARQGNWREAVFRWQRALKQDPANPRLHNNLAVAYESLGEFEKADAEYRAALAAKSVPQEIRENHELFLKFYERHKEGAMVPWDEPAAPAKSQDAEGP